VAVDIDEARRDHQASHVNLGNGGGSSEIANRGDAVTGYGHVSDIRLAIGSIDNGPAAQDQVIGDGLGTG
jgi:hypothetical protein